MKSEITELYNQTLARQKALKLGTYPYSQLNFLQLLVTLYKPKQVLELGTAIGLTSCLMASLSRETVVDTIDKNLENIQVAEENIQKLRLQKQIHLIHGEFLTVLPKLTKKYDMLFFDGYEPDLELILASESCINSGSLVVWANLWGKRVSECQKRLENEEIYNSFFKFDDTCVAIFN